MKPKGLKDIWHRWVLTVAAHRPAPVDVGRELAVSCWVLAAERAPYFAKSMSGFVSVKYAHGALSLLAAVGTAVALEAANLDPIQAVAIHRGFRECLDRHVAEVLGLSPDEVFSFRNDLREGVRRALREADSTSILGQPRAATDRELVALEIMTLLENLTGCGLSELNTQSVEICERVFSAAALATLDHLRGRGVAHADVRSA